MGRTDLGQALLAELHIVRVLRLDVAVRVQHERVAGIDRTLVGRVLGVLEQAERQSGGLQPLDLARRPYQTGGASAGKPASWINC